MLISLFTWIVKITGWLPKHIFLRNKIYYEDKNMQSRKIKGSAIVVANHNSVMDFAVMMYTFPFKTLRCVVAEVLYQKNFIFSIFLRMMGTVRVDRSNHDFEFIEKCSSILSKGGTVEIYPESRLPKKGEERPLPFAPSTVYLALETGAPIIPVYNARKGISPKGSSMIIGKPINLRDFYDEQLDEKQNIENLNKMLRGKIIELGKQLEQSKEKEKIRQ